MVVSAAADTAAAIDVSSVTSSGSDCLVDELGSEAAVRAGDEDGRVLN
jgi:hypothetical protein